MVIAPRMALGTVGDWMGCFERVSILVGSLVLLSFTG